MATATLDEGLGYLQAFNGKMADANRGLHDGSAELQSAENALRDLGREAEDAIGGLNDGLEDALDTLTSAGEAAESALEELAGTAHGAAAERLEAVASKSTEVGDEQARRDEAAQAEEEGSFSRLEESGFAAHEGAVREAESGLERTEAESTQAFAGLGEALQASGSDMGEAGDDLGSSLDESEQALSGEASQLATELKEAAGRWVAEIDDALSSGCQAIDDALEALFESWRERATLCADSMAEAVTAAMERTGQFVADDVQGVLTAAIDLLLQGPAQQLVSELEEDAAAIDGASGLAGVLEPMVPELETTLRVVAQVDQLLAQME
jgi:uncharacterized phage infection (PIP) family protein YhgE